MVSEPSWYAFVGPERTWWELTCDGDILTIYPSEVVLVEGIPLIEGHVF
jgi:hypothetical protein